MTYKQIIIDNVDVSGCESFCNGVCCKVGFGDDASCKLFSDCHYKNWKRKEQECEELKKENYEYFELMAIRTEVLAKIANKLGMNTGIIENKELFCKIDQLKAENDYLKHKIFRYDEIFKHSADMLKNPVTAIEVETFQSGVKALGNSLIAEENNKLHKTLTEIKKLCSTGIVHGLSADEYATNLNILKFDILQKISECEVEE